MTLTPEIKSQLWGWKETKHPSVVADKYRQQWEMMQFKHWYKPIEA